jgi:hypothetical protein
MACLKFMTLLPGWRPFLRRAFATCGGFAAQSYSRRTVPAKRKIAADVTFAPSGAQEPIGCIIPVRLT